MTIRLDPSADAHLNAALTAAMTRIVQEIADDAQRLVPVNTGRLRASIQWELSGTTGRVSTDVPYWRYVEYGTPPHMIRPNAKKALFWDGADHPVAKVHHPGTAAQPFLRPALLTHRGPR